MERLRLCLCTWTCACVLSLRVRSSLAEVLVGIVVMVRVGVKPAVVARLREGVGEVDDAEMEK